MRERIRNSWRQQRAVVSECGMLLAVRELRLIRRIFLPEPSRTIASHYLIQGPLLFADGCFLPDYILLGGQRDFERIQNLALILVGFGQPHRRRLCVYFEDEKGQAAQCGQRVANGHRFPILRRGSEHRS